MRSSPSTRVVAYFLYTSLSILAVFVLLSNVPSNSIQRVEVYQSTHYPWLPYVTKESLAARVQSLEEQLSFTRQALQQASDSASIHQASIQRTGSAAKQKHADVSNDVSEALSTVSASLQAQDVVSQGLPESNSTSGLEGMPPGSTVFVTFVNGDEKYREMMLNWALHLRAVEVWHVVVAFDDKAAATCAEQGIPFIRHTDTLASGDFRADFNRFRQMGSNKPLIVQRLMDDASASTVVISDVDTVWLRDPSEFLLRHPSADVLISTDCLSHWIETHAAEVHEQVAAGDSSVRQTFYHRCGHLPGASFGRAFNTGVIMFRDRPATRKLLEQWRELLLDPEKAYAPSQRGTAFAVTDQLALNILLEQNITPIASADPSGDWRVVLAHDQQLRLMPLPSLAFTNGHVFFYQHLPEVHGVKAYVVHATFQRHHTAGKRARMREEGLWLPESSEYFQADRLISYTNDVQSYVTALEASALESSSKESSTYSPMPALLKHFHAMAYQLAALRDAFGFASALNRTLDWYASILTACRMDGSDLPLPFTCPLDMLLNPGLLDKANLAPYRMESYLSDPRTPPRVAQSQERVTVYQQPQEAVAARIRSNGAGGALWAGIRAGQLTEELADMHAVHVLRFEGLRPGTFGGWSALDRGEQVSLADGESLVVGAGAGSAAGTELGSSSGAWAPGIVERFDQQYSVAIGDEAKWCCSGEQPIDVGWITWWYPLPPPLASAQAPHWSIPKFDTPPAHCSRIEGGEAGDLNVQFTKLENHPCNFMKRRWVLPDRLSDLLYTNSTFKT